MSEPQAPFALAPMSALPNTLPARDAGLDMPAGWLRTRLQIVALELRLEARDRKCMEASCIADALEDYACGEVAAAHEAMDCAAAMRRAAMKGGV